MNTQDHQHLQLGLCTPAHRHDLHTLTLLVQSDGQQWSQTIALDLRAEAPKQFLLWRFPLARFHCKAFLQSLSGMHSEFRVRGWGSLDLSDQLDLSVVEPDLWVVLMYAQLQQCPAAIVLFNRHGRISLVTGGAR